MTRRRVLFINSDGKTYLTEEYNGDKSEFARFGAGDSCEKDWRDIMDEFRDCLSLDLFLETDRRCQSYYHSCLGTTEYHGPEEVDLATLDDTAGIYVTAAHPIPKAGMEPVARFLQQHIANLENAISLIEMSERAFSKQILTELLEPSQD